MQSNSTVCFIGRAPIAKSTARRQFITASLLLGMIFSGPVGCFETRRGREQTIARGRLLFEVHCCGCHNGKRSDLPIVPPYLAGIFTRPRLPSGAPATDDAVRSTILTGRSGIMPSFEDSLSKEEINDIIRYLHTVAPQTPMCKSD
jgi:mono/diheme cytochrome c family protein